MSRKDGRPRIQVDISRTSVRGRNVRVTPLCEHGLEIDDYPWAHQNGGRIPLRYGHADNDTWDPRRRYCQDAACYS
jgi:hypothetical protein